MTKRLLILNGLACLMVPFHHAAAYGLSAMFLWTDRYRAVTVPNYDQLGSLSYYLLMISRELHSFAIPAFLFVSGFFLAFMARGKKAEVGWQMVSGRIKILLPPLILWTFLRYVLLRHPPTSLDDILNPYWFIVLLIQYYLLAPVLLPIAQRNWKLLLAGTIVIQLAVWSLRYPFFLGLDFPGLQLLIKLTPRWLFPMYLFNFSLGMVAGLNLKPFKGWLGKVKWGLLAVLIGSALLTFVEYEIADRFLVSSWIGSNFTGLVDLVYATSFSLCFLAFEDVSLPFSRPLSELGTRSLGIYLVNIPAIYVVAVLLYDLAPWTLGNQVVYQTLLIAAGLGGPILLMELMRRSKIRGAYRYVFG